uniref:Uncharacterized protein n=1 Tax=Sphaerodactylus townsendi TaxID=933632 RepID=A0ACB8ES65_9SAUR
MCITSQPLHAARAPAWEDGVSLNDKASRKPPKHANGLPIAPSLATKRSGAGTGRGGQTVRPTPPENAANRGAEGGSQPPHVENHEGWWLEHYWLLERDRLQPDSSETHEKIQHIPIL